MDARTWPSVALRSVRSPSGEGEVRVTGRTPDFLEGSVAAANKPSNSSPKVSVAGGKLTFWRRRLISSSAAETLCSVNLEKVRVKVLTFVIDVVNLA